MDDELRPDDPDPGHGAVVDVTAAPLEPTADPTPTPSSGVNRLDRNDWMAIALTGLAASVVYILTLERHVGAWDIAEFQTVPHLFGISHPTGYPLFTVLGGLWSWLPFGNMATRMNLLSALLFAGTGATICAIGLRLQVRRWFAASGALVFAFASGTWRNAVHIEVQSLHLLLFSLLILSWLMAREDPTPRRIATMALVGGLGIAHHGLMPIMLIPLAGSFIVSHLRIVCSWRTIRLALPAAVLPLGFFLYLPLRADSAPILDSNPTLSWWDIIRGEGFRGTIGQRPSLRIWRDNVDLHYDLLSRWTGVLVLVLAVLGIGALARRAPRSTLGIVAVGLLASYVQANSTDDNDRYLLGTVLVVALFAGVGADAIGSVVRSLGAPQWRTAGTVLCAGLFAIVPLNILRANYSTHDARHRDIDEVNGRKVLDALPQGCVIWAYWDLRTTLFYLTRIDGYRSDITVLDSRSTVPVGIWPQGDDLYRGIQLDPKTAGRPACFIGQPGFGSTARPGFRLVPLVVAERPWGLARLSPDYVYLVEPA